MASKAQRQKNQALHRENNKKERIAQLNAEKLQLTRDILSEWEMGTHIVDICPSKLYAFIKKYPQLHQSQAVTSIIKQYGLTDKSQIACIKAYFKEKKDEMAKQNAILKEEKQKAKIIRDSERAKQMEIRKNQAEWNAQLIISTAMPTRLQITKTEYIRWRDMGKIPVSKVVEFRKWGQVLETAFHHPSDIQHINSTLIEQWRAEDKAVKTQNRLKKQSQTEWLKPLKSKVRKLKTDFFNQIKDTVNTSTQNKDILLTITKPTQFIYSIDNVEYQLPISVYYFVDKVSAKWEVNGENDVRAFETKVNKLKDKIEYFEKHFIGKMKETEAQFHNELISQLTHHSIQDEYLQGILDYIHQHSQSLHYDQMSRVLSRNIKQAIENAHQLKRDSDIKKQLESYTDSFFIAKSIDRHFKLYVGPTNSGKTYEGIQALKKAQSGVYLAPLRLLALEVYEKLNTEGIPCNLITGEQRIIVPNAKHTAATIECLDFMTPVEVAVIDEAQMYADDQRGWAWTNAILGCPANEIYVVGMKMIELHITQLLDQYQLSYDINNTERFSRLVVENKPVTQFHDFKNGDALIAFSKNEVLAYYIALKSQYNVSVIYGAMPPEQRTRQAEQFRNQVNQSDKPAILVATDAIGMGLNLPINRIIFTAMNKWNGKNNIALSIDQVLQIAGRAGRRIQNVVNEGYVAGVNSGMTHLLKEYLHNTNPEKLQKFFNKKEFYVMPTQQQVSTLAKLLKTEKLSVILRYFQEKVALTSPLLKKADLSEKIALAMLLEKVDGNHLNDLLKFVMAPVSKEYEIEYLKKIYKMWKNKNQIKLEITGGKALDLLEQSSSKLTIYSTLAHHYPDIFVDLPQVDSTRTMLSQRIAKALKEHQGVLVAKQLGQCEYVRQYKEWDDSWEYM